MPQFATKPLSWFKINSQVRKFFDEESLRCLGFSLKKKQLQPLLTQPDGIIIAGERRYRAAVLVGLETLEVKIADEVLSDQQVKVWQLVENMARQDLSAFEKWTGCYELMCANPGWKQKDLAEALNVSESMAVRLLSPSRCIQPWQDALRDGKCGLSDCYAASQISEKEQAELLKLKLNGASRDEVAAAGRRARNGNGQPTVKLDKVKVALPGALVTISGKDLDMGGVCDLLAETLKQARKAADQYDVKTFVRMMADVAKG